MRIPADCNHNGIEDDQEVADGAPDCNGNEIPDECEPDEDCNGNKRQDICDIAAGSSDDCNRNQVPDDCEPNEDCNKNGAVDICDIDDGTSLDCNGNSIPDDCDVSSGFSPDENADGVPDECQGACCLCKGCVDTTATSCAAQSGAFMKLGRLCEGTVCEPLSNDACVDAQVVPTTLSAVVSFDNRCATNDGPDTVFCDNSGSQPFGADIWYQTIAACDGDLTVSLCDTTDYDAIVAIYGGTPNCRCPFEGAPLRACSDDSCGVGGGPPTITLPVIGGSCYTIRVAGWNGAKGTGEMSLVLEPRSTGNDCQPNLIPDECDIGAGLSDDCNVNDVPDECGPGDSDGDETVGLPDHADFTNCMTGPCGAVPCAVPPEAPVCCTILDFDGNGSIDLRDTGSFQNAFGGP